MSSETIWFIPPPNGIKDARWFAVDLHVPLRKFGFLHLDEAILESSTFLDNRIAAPWEKAVPLTANQISMRSLPAPQGAFLFHTSYCSSTLLARCLHAPPYGVALKEPLLLRRLSDARFSRWNIDKLLPKAVHLLTRPWHAGGAVLLKPTHVALNIASNVMTALPQTPGLMLTSTLHDFLLSNIKKTAETQAKVPELVKRALSAMWDSSRFSQEMLRPPDFLSAVALQWCVQQEVIGELLATVGSSRLRVLQQQDFLADINSSVLRAATWLQWPAPPAILQQRIAAIAGRHAKSTERMFDAKERERESQLLESMFRDPLHSAVRWAERLLFPIMRSSVAIKKALLP